ncbi:MAG: hypothetical protein GY822_27245 [Deltaproteobacteria bacterium]|nr:hypothetical protein [Deltaproteobacteria bacterium]
MHSPDQSAASAASPFSQDAKPQLSAGTYQPYGFSNDVIGWISEAWSLGQKSFGLQFAMLLVVGGVTFLTSLVLGGAFVGAGCAIGKEFFSAFIITGGILGIGLMYFGYLLALCGCFAVLEGSARGEESSFSENIRTIMALATRLAGLFVATGVVGSLIMGIGGSVSMVGTLLGSTALTFVGFLVLIVVMVVTFPMLYMSAIIMTVEETSIIESIKLGFNRTIPHIGQLLLGMFILCCAMFAVLIAVGIPITLLSVIVPFFGFIVQMVSLVITPFSNAWFFVVYGNLRDQAEA